MARYLIASLAMLLAASSAAEVWPSHAGRSAQTVAYGADEVEPDVAVGDVLRVGELGTTAAWNADTARGIPVRGRVTVTGFRCVYDSTQIIGGDSFVLCATPITSSGVVGALSGTCTTLVSGSLALDYIAPSTAPSTSFDASSTDTIMGVYVQAKTDVATADNSSLAVMCYVDFIQSM